MPWELEDPDFPEDAPMLEIERDEGAIDLDVDETSVDVIQETVVEPPPPPPVEALDFAEGGEGPGEPWSEDRPIIVPEDERFEAPETHAPIEPTPREAPAPEHMPSPASQLLDHRGFQVVVVIGVGLGALAVLPGGPSTPSEPPMDLGPSRFPEPKVELRAEEVTVKDVKARWAAEDVRSVAPDPRASGGGPDRPKTKAEPSTGPLTLAQPGFLYTDEGHPAQVVSPAASNRPTRLSIGSRSRRSAAKRRTAEKRPRTPTVPDEPELDFGAEMFGGGIVEGLHQKKSAAPALDLPIGQRLPVKLLVGVSSLAPGQVMAQLTEDVGPISRPLLRAQDVLRGRAEARGERLFLTFHTVQTGSETKRIQGYAISAGMPGIKAHRRTASAQERSTAGALQGALGAAGQVVVDVVGAAAAPGQVVRGLTEGGLPEAQQALAPDDGMVLELPAGTAFEVIITQTGDPR